MTGKVYLRNKVAVSRLIQVQESELASENEVTISHPPLQTASKLQSTKPLDHNLLIALKKGTRECTKHPLYPLYHVSFEKLYPSHKSFFTSLNNIHIPITLSEALSNENWKQFLNAKMEASKKNKTWELIDLLVGKKPKGCGV